MGRAKFCPKCNTENLYYSDKCSNCGTNILAVDVVDTDNYNPELKKFLENRGLKGLDETDILIISDILRENKRMGFLGLSMAFDFSKPEEHLKSTQLFTVIEQNWMVLKQLSRLNANIEKLLNK